jgi:hypothetical protein
VTTVSGVVDDAMEAFFEFATDFADGERWRLLRARGWDDFVERLANTVGDLPPRRRQALMMLLFVLVEGLADPADVRDWLEGHDIRTDAGVEQIIAWLRGLRGEPR